jgi:hypothetical protein
MDQQELIDELRERIARLEAVKPRRRAYNQQQAAQQLNMSVAKLRGLHKAGRIKPTLSGRIWVYTDETLEDYLAALDDQ